MLVVPLVLFLLMTSLGLWGVYAAAQAARDSAKSDLAERNAIRRAFEADQLRSIEREIAQERETVRILTKDVAQDIENAMFEVQNMPARPLASSQPL